MHEGDDKGSNGSELKIREIKSEDELRQAVMDGITLVDFNAPWCAPCRLQEPIIHRMAERFQKKALIATSNIDKSNEIAMKMGIQSIPTLVIFKNNKEIQRFVGLQSEDALSEALGQLLKQL